MHNLNPKTLNPWTQFSKFYTQNVDRYGTLTVGSVIEFEVRRKT